MVEESQQRKRKSEANLFVVPFGRYNLSETMPLTMMKRLDEEVPPVFMILGIIIVNYSIVLTSQFGGLISG